MPYRLNEFGPVDNTDFMVSVHSTLSPWQTGHHVKLYLANDDGDPKDNF